MKFPNLASGAVALAFALSVAPAAAPAQGGPTPEVRAAIESVIAMLGSSDEATLRKFMDERLAAGFRSSMSDEAMLAHLNSLRKAAAGKVGGISVERDQDGIILRLSGSGEAEFLLDLDNLHRLTRLALKSGPPQRERSPTHWDGATWDNLDARFREWESNGFSGVVLARRGGESVLRKSYGYADRSAGRPTLLTTIYGIGSTPIDFTRTGILLLAQRGKLSLADSIGRFWPDVHADKRGMTLEHLMRGRSGLPDFHHVQGTDWDYDLAWIDRGTAVKRILGQKLLFAPGTSSAHSHSAFGLLAAVIEIVSGKSYQQFVRDEILTPLGMTRTGFYGDRGNFAVADFAVGAGPSHVGLPNIPPNWGPTSWLVMGSGGMYSTLDDMARYYEALEKGKLLSGDWARMQQGETVDVGGSDRGFFIFHVSNNRGESVLGLTNGEGRTPGSRAMLRSMERLVFGK